MFFHIPIQQRHAQAARMKRQSGYEPSAIYIDEDDPVETEDTPEPSRSGSARSTPSGRPTTTSESSASQRSQSTESTASSTSEASSEQPSPSAPPRASPPAANTPTRVQDTTVITTLKLTTGAASSSPSITAPAEPSSNNKTGMIIGGIGAAAVAAVAIIFAVTFFIRRSRKRKDYDGSPFDADNFRRSAVLLDDKDPYRPNPPMMTEHRASPAPTFGTKYGAPPPAGYLERGLNFGLDGHDNGPYPSFQPGQYVPSPVTATSAHGMMSDTPRMPDSPYDDQAQYLTRYPSVSEHHLATPVTVQPQPVNNSNVVPADDYVDLSRSSVSPFQAAQYAEISRQLNTEVPQGLTTPAVAQFVNQDRPMLQTVGEANEEEEKPKMPEPQTVSPFDDDQELEFPTPPAMGTRIDSKPPVLPEIHVRNGSYDFPSSVRGSSIDSNATGNEVTAPAPPYGQKFTLAPSPLANSTGLIPEPDTESVKDATPVAPTPPPAEPVVTQPKVNDTIPVASKPVIEEPKKRPDTMYSTIYDPNDAYGGI